MFSKVYDNPEIYNIHIPLPKNPLKNLNCYVIKSNGEAMITDTGFNMPECRKALYEGIDELGLKTEDVTLFLTHLHSDHTGLASGLYKKGIKKIYMGRTDYDYYKDDMLNDSYREVEYEFYKNGFPKWEMESLVSTGAADGYEPEGLFKAESVDDNEKIKVGDVEITCIETPGHTPGHMCLYIEKEKIMFTGDHILFDITPNITFWTKAEDSLGDYLKSLDKIEKYDVKTTFTSHRANDGDFYERIKSLKKHHEIRINECLRIIKENPSIHAYDTAAKMTWSIRSKSWKDFPSMQKYFAVGEAISHIDHLYCTGRIKRELKDGIYYYSAI